MFLLLRTDAFVKNFKETQNKFSINIFLGIKKYLCDTNFKQKLK